MQFLKLGMARQPEEMPRGGKLALSRCVIGKSTIMSGLALH